MQAQFSSRQNRMNALTRAQRRGDESSYFLHDEAALIIAERIAVTNREFENVGFLFDGPHAEHIKQLILSNTTNTPNQGTLIPLPDELSIGDEKTEDLNIAKDSFDLVISTFDLHWVNDLPGVLNQINNALKPDGLLMIALPAEGTLSELNQCLVEAETQFRGGAAIRVGPFAQIRSLGDLLRRANFKLPVADLEPRTINYTSFAKLLDDLRNTGSTNANCEKVIPFSQTAYLKCKEIYLEKFKNEAGKLTVSVNLAFLLGWKEHASQQKPLSRGSAKNKLSDFL